MYMFFSTAVVVAEDEVAKSLDEDFDKDLDLARSAKLLGTPGGRRVVGACFTWD